MDAIEQSCKLAQRGGLSIGLLYVIKTNSSFWKLFSEKEQKKIELKAENKLKYLAKEIRETKGLKVECLIRKGHIVEEILTIADYLPTRMIVMATRLEEGISGKLRGTKTLQVIKSSKIPVISARGNFRDEICENILLPLDLSKPVEQKIEWAVRFAQAFRSKIQIVHLHRFIKQTEVDKINQHLETITKSIIERGIEASSMAVYSISDNKEFKAKKILSYAHKVHSDLIVLMTKGENNISNLLLGSLAKHIIFKSDIPVLSITPNNI